MSSQGHQRREATVLTPRVNWTRRESEKKADAERIYIRQDQTVEAVKRHFIDKYNVDPNTPLHAFQHQLARWGLRKRETHRSNPTPPATPQQQTWPSQWQPDPRLPDPAALARPDTPVQWSPAASTPVLSRPQTAASMRTSRTPAFYDDGTAHLGYPRNWYVPLQGGRPLASPPPPSLGLTGDQGSAFRPPPPVRPNNPSAQQQQQQQSAPEQSSGYYSERDPQFPNGRPRGIFEY